MNRGLTVSALAGLIPVIAVNLALAININAGLDACFPYWEGCLSVSRAVRSGPGLLIFKLLAWPTAFLMIYSWKLSADWLRRQNPTGRKQQQLIFWMGAFGAVFFLIYANWLGTDGELYRWLRRYGVVFYFGLTALAQLTFASGLWNIRKTRHGVLSRYHENVYFGIISLSWLLGVSSAFKRKLIEDPVFQDQVENLLEWNFALVLSLTFVALGFVIRSDHSSTK